jgi:hypothetical protein
LCNASMRTQPTAPQRPKPCHAIDMHCTNAVALFISGVLAPALVAPRMIRAPRLKTGIHAALLRVPQGAGRQRVFEAWRDGLLRHLGQQRHHHLPPTFHHATDGGLFLRQRATANLALASASTPFAPLALDDFGGPFMAGSHLGCIALDLVG